MPKGGPAAATVTNLRRSAGRQPRVWSCCLIAILPQSKLNAGWALYTELLSQAVATDEALRPKWLDWQTLGG